MEKKSITFSVPVITMAPAKAAAQRALTGVQRALHIGPFSAAAQLEALHKRLTDAETALYELEGAKDYDFDEFVTEREMERAIKDSIEDAVSDIDGDDLDISGNRTIKELDDRLDSFEDGESFDRYVAESEAVSQLNDALEDIKKENTALKAVLYRLVSVSGLPDEVRAEAMNHLGDGNYPNA